MTRKITTDEEIMAGMEIGKQYTAEEIAAYHFLGIGQIRLTLNRMSEQGHLRRVRVGRGNEFIREHRENVAQFSMRPMKITREMQVAMDRVANFRATRTLYPSKHV